MESIKKEAAIVTGASSGIGYAISTKLSALGYQVFGIGRNFQKVENKIGNNIHPIVCDILDTDKRKFISAMWLILMPAEK